MVQIPLDCDDLNWNNDNFLDSGFWELNPNNDQIKCALYGENTGDTTAYTV
jgi:hypothetical protein